MQVIWCTVDRVHQSTARHGWSAQDRLRVGRCVRTGALGKQETGTSHVDIVALGMR